MHFSARSILFADGKNYNTQKKLIKPAFTLHGAKVFMGIYNEKTEEMTKLIDDQMASNSGTCELKLLDYLFKLCLDIIGECAIGYKFNSLSGSETKEISSLLSFTSTEFNISRTALEETLPFAKYMWLEDRRKCMEGRSIIVELVQKVLTTRLEELEDDDDVFEKGDLLDILLKMYDPFSERETDQELCNQILTFIIGGLEPLALTIFWTLFLLAKHPEIQEEVRQEIRHVMGAASNEISLELIGSFDLLTRCIKESQRLYPSLILVRRTAKKDDKLGEYIIPAGTDIAVGICSVHRDPKWWKNPTKFDPNRFDASSDKDANMTYKFLPYGRGSRMCLATSFVEFELKVVLAKLISKFQFSLSSDQPLELPCQVKVSLHPRISPVFLLTRAP